MTPDEMIAALEGVVTSIKADAAARTDLTTDRLIELSGRSFDDLVAARNHLQDMSGRILAAMAFLTAAAAQVYQRAPTPANPADTNWALLAVSGYMLFVLLGATAYMSGMWPPQWPALREDERRVHSIHYFDSLKNIGNRAAVPRGGTERFDDAMLDVLLSERLVTAKVAASVGRHLLVGSGLFMAAFVCFVGLIATLFGPDTRQVLAAFLLGTGGLTATYTTVTHFRDLGEGTSMWTRAWGLLTILLASLFVMTMFGWIV